MLHFGLAHQYLALGRLDAETAEMVRLENQHRPRSQDNFSTTAINHRGRTPMKRSGIEARRGAEDAVVDRADAAGDLNRVAVEFVNFTSGRNGHALAHSGLNCQLHGCRIGDIADNRALGVLLEQFGQNCGAVARSSGATAVGQIAKHDRTFIRIDRLADRLFN